jgi:hypothetical protein
MIKNILTLIVLLTLCQGTHAATRNVPQQYPTIQAAIQAASNGDTILVAPGTYHENISFMGKGIVVASTFIITSDTSLIRSTVIDGSSPIYPDSASCVRITSKSSATYADTTAMLTGFTIRGGTGTRWQDEHNPGSWYREGGGLLIQYLSPRIRFNHFTDNKAVSTTNCVSAGGGAIRCGDGNPTITNNIIDHNQGLYGGGLVFNFSGATLKNNIISGNSGGQDYGGGGIWAYGQEAHGKPRIIENNTIVNNASILSGGGIRVWSSSMTIINNIIWGNTASVGSQISVVAGTAAVTYCDVQNGYTGNGNMNQIPVFDNSSYFLSTGSPCVDKGDSTAQYTDPLNPSMPAEAKFPARGLVRNDMGAYGGHGSALMGNMSTVYTGIGDKDPVAASAGSVTISPNPCRDTFNLAFRLKDGQSISITVSDQEGRIPISLQNLPAHQGWNNTSLDVSMLKPGNHIIVIRSETETFVSRFIKVQD